MIGVLELRERAREWSLREDIVEKDYVLGWLLWGITSPPPCSHRRNPLPLSRTAAPTAWPETWPR